MNDDLEPQLTEHLQQRAGRVNAPADVADVHHRITERHRKRTRALGTALAIALVAGPVVGWALARTTEPDRDTLTAVGGGGADDAGNSGGTNVTYTEGYLDQGPFLGQYLHPVSARTNGEGLRLIVHSTDLGQSNGPCMVDGTVRVAIVDGDVVDVLYLPTAPGGASFLIGGTADGRPLWVVVARGFEDVEAAFPNGATDAAEATDGLAVLAAYAVAGEAVDALVDDVIDLSGTPMVDMLDTRQASYEQGNGGCEGDGVVPPTEPPIMMPEPGEPPADEDAARAEITALFSRYGGHDPHTEVGLHEEPAVWLDAALRFQEETPDYFEWAKEVYGVVEEIVFTAPDRATVRSTLVSDNPEIPAPGEMIGEAVLIDGIWKASIESSCAGLALAGIECDYSLKE